jgi:hypothetical protein
MYVSKHKAKVFGDEFDGSAQQRLGEAVSGTNTNYGLPFRPGAEGRFSVHLGWTGTPTGTFTLWYTDLEAPGLANDADWVEDTTWAPVNPTGSAGSMYVTTGNVAALWVRVKYVNASGSGTLWGHMTTDAA